MAAGSQQLHPHCSTSPHWGWGSWCPGWEAGPFAVPIRCMGLPHRMRPGHLMPSVCTSSHCLPAAPSCPVPAHTARCCLESLLQAIHVHHYIPSAGRVAAGSLAPAPGRMCAIACLAAPEGREQADSTAGSQGWCWFDSPWGGSHPASIPMGCSSAETSLGVEQWEQAGRGMAQCRAVNTLWTRGCCHNPIHRLSPASGSRQHRHGAAPAPGFPRWVPRMVHAVPSPALGDSSPSAVSPQGKATTASLHRCLFPWPSTGATPQRPMIGCRAGHWRWPWGQVGEPSRAPRAAAGCSIALVSGCCAVVGVWSQKWKCPGRS